MRPRPAGRSGATRGSRPARANRAGRAGPGGSGRVRGRAAADMRAPRVFCQALVCRFTVGGCPGYRSIVYRVTVGWFRLVLVVLLLHEGVGPSVGFALEPDHASVVDGAVDDRGGHVGVAEHPAPSAGLDVGGVDDALGLVRVGHDLEQESAAFLVDGHVAELVDDDHAGLGDGLRFPVEFAFRVGAQEPHDQARGGVEPHRHALPAGLPAQRDGEVGLAGAGRPEHDHVLRTVEEAVRRPASAACRPAPARLPFAWSPVG